jgi:hypothetical protein
MPDSVRFVSEASDILTRDADVHAFPRNPRSLRPANTDRGDFTQRAQSTAKSAKILDFFFAPLCGLCAKSGATPGRCGQPRRTAVSGGQRLGRMAAAERGGHPDPHAILCPVSPILRLAALLSIVAFAAGCPSPPPPVPAPSPVPTPIAAPEDPAPDDHCSGGDEQPCTWVRRLAVPAMRAGALVRLVQSYEDAMTLDGADRSGPHVKPLLDETVEPVTQVCVAGKLDPGPHGKVVKLLADTRDPRAEPCFTRTLQGYEPDRTEDDVRAVCRAVAAMKLQSAAAPPSGSPRSPSSTRSRRRATRRSRGGSRRSPTTPPARRIRRGCASTRR